MMFLNELGRELSYFIYLLYHNYMMQSQSIMVAKEILLYMHSFSRDKQTVPIIT